MASGHEAQPRTAWPVRLAQGIGQVIEIDVRSLAAFRIGAAVILLADLLGRSHSLVEHYSDLGVLPRKVLMESQADAFHWSLHLLSGRAEAQAVMFIVAAIAAIALLLGYHTWLATLASWVMLSSLQERNPLLNAGGDSLLRLMLFWSLFLPLGRVWSLDALDRPASAAELRPPRTGGTAAALLQLAALYVFAGVHKINEVWLSGDAMYYALHNDIMVRSFGIWCLQFPLPLKVISWITPWMEVFLPLVCFIPWRMGWWRLAAIVGFFLLHLGIELTMTIGIFMYVCMVTWLLYVPGAWWDRLGGPFKLTTSPGSASNERSTQGSAAALLARTPHLLAQTLAGLLCVYMVVWNIDGQNKRFSRAPWLPVSTHWVAGLFKLHQDWPIFAKPNIFNGWYVIVGTLADGTQVEMLTHQPFDPQQTSRPAVVSELFPDDRWRKYYSNLSRDDFERFRPFLPAVLTRQWNSTHPEPQQVQFIEINFVSEITQPPGHPATLKRKVFFRGVGPRSTDVLFTLPRQPTLD